MNVLTWIANDADEPMSVLVYGHHNEILVEQVHLKRQILSKHNKYKRAYCSGLKVNTYMNTFDYSIPIA